jgi:putative endonuclease
MYQAYILNNSAGQSYIGLSQVPDQRLNQHNADVSKWTRGRGPWSLVWTSQQMSLGEARKLENKLKRQKGGAGLETLKNLHGS